MKNPYFWAKSKQNPDQFAQKECGSISKSGQPDQSGGTVYVQMLPGQMLPGQISPWLF